MMRSVYELKKEGDDIEPLMYSFPNLEPVCCSNIAPPKFASRLANLFLAEEVDLCELFHVSHPSGKLYQEG